MPVGRMAVCDGPGCRELHLMNADHELPPNWQANVEGDEDGSARMTDVYCTVRCRRRHDAQIAEMMAAGTAQLRARQAAEPTPVVELKPDMEKWGALDKATPVSDDQDERLPKSRYPEKSPHFFPRRTDA